ncbi:unnamed protein product, partial [Musa textilis]
ATSQKLLFALITAIMNPCKKVKQWQVQGNYNHYLYQTRCGLTSPWTSSKGYHLPKVKAQSLWWLIDLRNMLIFVLCEIPTLLLVLLRFS